MSLLTSMSSGTTGLASASSELSVVSDNIANSNTVGFKSGRAAFEDALAQSVVGGLGQIGLGSRLQAVQRLLTQGALSNTGVTTDLALQGQGFFVVHGTAADGRVGTFYTRAGQFTVDRDGYLTNLDGLRVQGYPADAAGALQPMVGDLLVGTASSQPRATALVTVRGNLAADAALSPAWVPADPAGTSSFSTSATVYDSLGKSYAVQIYFSHATNAPPAGSTWDYHAMVDGAAVGGVAGTPTEIGRGTLAYDSQGRLVSNTPAAGFSFTPVGAVSPQALTFDFGDATSAGGTGLGGFTQFAGVSSASFVGQDGWASGVLNGIQFDKTGMIQGLFSNGQTRALGEVAVAQAPAADQMERVGGNLYVETRASGQLVAGTAGQGGRGFISAGALEQSNVDIAEQFVRMIAAQRAFEANSKTITTADQLLSELIAMKR
jgi:flagellar hook protein FlgE